MKKLIHTHIYYMYNYIVEKYMNYIVETILTYYTERNV